MSDKNPHHPSSDPATRQLDAERKRGIRRTVAILLVLVTAVVALVVFNVVRAPTLDREALREQGVILFDQPRRLSDFELQAHDGEAFTGEDLRGQWTFVFFGFTHCPDICPMAMADLSRLMGQLPEDVAEQTRVVMVTLDPARDTPEVLAEYVPYFHPEFVGVTGEFLTIRSLANEMNVAFAKVTQEEGYTVDHSGHINLINPKGDYHAIFKSPFDIDAMQQNYRALRESF